MEGRAVQLRSAARFTTKLYAGRARAIVDAHVRRNEFARLSAVGDGDPYPIYDRIRAAGPFVTTPTGHLATADHAICKEVLRDRRFGVEPEGAPRPEPAFDRSLLTRNPPDHTRLRRLVAPALSARRLADFTVMLEETVGRLLDDAGRTGSFDVMPALAEPLPVAVINRLLGIPDEDGAVLAAYGETLGGAAAGFRSPRHARDVMVAARAMVRLFEEVIERRRADPGDDLISSLLAAEGEGDTELRAVELVPMCRMLLIAGFETTVNLLGNAVNALLDHPDQWAALVANPALAGAVVQESLRFDSPVQRTGRISFDDTEIAGQPIRRGQWVNVLIGGANRDPQVFDEPNTFDLARTDLFDHLAFSSGIHRCVGRPIAELEGSVALRMLAERMPGLHRAGPARMRAMPLVRGPLSVPVAVG
ncbi:cytochrome P450 [Nocardioides hankookensis]|uniref:Cytochrome P450 n=1 Tax=Nocardioides hankookensis TaxID=443157 RepID=A0ABW1LJW9_9ACTN